MARAPLLAVLLALPLAGCLASTEPLVPQPLVQLQGFRVEPPGLVAPGQVVGVAASLVNTGREVGDVTSALLVGGIAAGPGKTFRLFPGEAQELRHYWTPPGEGRYALRLALSNGAWQEAEVRVGRATVIVDRLELFPASVELGDPVSLLFDLANAGSAPATVSADVAVNGEVVRHVAAMEVPAGGVRGDGFTFFARQPGALGVAILLSHGPAAEGRGWVRSPDLQVAQWLADRDGCEGEVQVSARVHNAGDGVARGAWAELALDGQPAVRRDLGDLAAGHEEEVHAALAAPRGCDGSVREFVLVLGAAHAPPHAWRDAWVNGG